MAVKEEEHVVLEVPAKLLSLTLDAITSQSVDDSITLHAYDLKYSIDSKELRSLDGIELIAAGLGADVGLVHEVNLNGQQLTSLAGLTGEGKIALFPKVILLRLSNTWWVQLMHLLASKSFRKQ